MALNQWNSTREIADEMAVDIGKVGDWISSGELAAVNVATVKGGIRPRWRISRQAFEQFLASRQSNQSATPTPRRKRQDASVVEYY